MSLFLLLVAFLTTGIANITNKAINQYGLDAYNDIYLLAFYGTGAVFAVLIHILRPRQIRQSDAKLGLAMGVAGALSLVFFMFAIAGMQGIVVFPVRSMANVILTAAASYMAWKEKLSKVQWLGLIISLVVIFLLC